MARKVKEKQQSVGIKADFHGHGKDVDYAATQAEVDSGVHLEDDEGYGEAAIIRQFKFASNPAKFNENPPTRQELFNAHLKQIEHLLWRDGLKIMTEVSPRLSFSQNGDMYTIIVGAKRAKGHLLLQTPKLLKDFAPRR